MLYHKNEGIYCDTRCAKESNANLRKLYRVTESQIMEDETNPEFWDVYKEDGETVSTPHCGQCCSNCLDHLWG